MKKYIQPNIKVTTVATEIICQSTVGFGGNTGDGNINSADCKSHEWEVMDGNEW